MSMDEYYRAVTILSNASTYLHVFPATAGSVKAQLDAVKKEYRRLLRGIHPDVVASLDKNIRDTADEMMKKLLNFYGQIVIAINKNAVGMIPSVASFDSAVGHHQTEFQVVDNCDMSQCFLASSTIAGDSSPTFVKIARQHIDNELLRAEAEAIGRLRATGDPAHVQFYPELLDSFGTMIAGKGLRVNVLRRLEGFYDLEQVRKVYTGGVTALHMGWMWRRVLWALDYVHKQGIIHGAVLPQNIMILPEQHGVVLVDWCYSTFRHDKQFQPLKAIVGRQRGWYPAEVLRKQAPVPALDIALGARSMVYLMGGNPETGKLPAAVPSETQRYFTDLISRGSDKSLDVYDAATRFDELLKRLGAPYYPRKFQVFSV